MQIPNTGAFTQADINAILGSLGIVPTGNIFYMDPVNGLDGNNGQFAQAIPGEPGQGPVRTLAAGYALLVSGHNDTLVLIGNGSTTGTARLDVAFTWSKSACNFVGICPPAYLSQRARIAPTGTSTAFANFFTVSGSGNYFANLQWFHGFNTGTTAAICMTVTGGRNTFQNCHFAGMGDTASAQSSTSRSLLVSGTGENVFQSCTIGLDTVASNTTNSQIEFAAGTPRNIFKDCLILRSTSSAGSLFVLGAGAACMDRFQLFQRCMFINAVKSGSTTLTAGVTLAASAGGLILLKDSTIVGATDWGSDATTFGQMYIDGAAPTNNTSGIAVLTA